MITPEASATDAVPAGALIQRLRRQIRETMEPLVQGCTTGALVDFPDHSNVGDSAIWAGEVIWLAQTGIRIAYKCDTATYSARHLERAAPAGPIFIHGGGNLGDLWPRHQRLRERVISDFPHRRIIQLPQTVHFQDAEKLARARQVFDAHPDLTVTVRDRMSFEYVQRHFRAAAVLCPDMAFWIDFVRREPPDVDILWLRREDKEASGDAAAVPSGIHVCDWIEEGVPPLRRVRRLLRPIAAGAPVRLSAVDWLIGAAYDMQARRLVQSGCRLLSRGRVVITDRLHAHILCMLLGIPHVLLDNNYGKVRRVSGTWITDPPQVRWAPSASEAVEMAQSMLDVAPGGEAAG